MKYPTAEDLAEMKVRGYETETIRLAVQQMERNKEAVELCQVIEKAFQDVKLESGIGLFQAQGLDDYADEATCAAFREKDEKDDWRRIAAEDLNGCHSSLSFFDAEGMRFHLPAFLILELQDFGMGITFHLTHTIVVDPTQFSLLSPEQRLSVRMFLLFLLNDPSESFDHPHIQHALDFYWVCPPS